MVRHHRHPIRPLYLKYLGIESYGLIGLFVSLMALLSIMDMGLSSTLSRELARLSVIPGTEQESRDLVRTMELVYWTIGALLALSTIALAPHLASFLAEPEGSTCGINPPGRGYYGIRNCVRVARRALFGRPDGFAIAGQPQLDPRLYGNRAVDRSSDNPVVGFSHRHRLLPMASSRKPDTNHRTCRNTLVSHAAPGGEKPYSGNPCWKRIFGSPPA